MKRKMGFNASIDVASFIFTFILLGGIAVADEPRTSAAYLYIDISTITTERYKNFKINNKDVDYNDIIVRFDSVEYKMTFDEFKRRIIKGEIK